MPRLLRAAYLILILFASFLSQQALAQNCTINAGADRTICPGQPFVLNGTATGLFAEHAIWTQISGPAVSISATTVSSGNATATVTGFATNVNYTFRLSAKCTDGSPVIDDAVYNASTLTIANAGPDQIICSGTISMAANPVKPGETGVWSVVSGASSVPSPSTSPTATVSFGSNVAGTSIFRWSVTNGTCTTFDDVQIVYRGGVMPVTAISPVNVGSCYSLTTSAPISGSFGGVGNGQLGTWSFISGPNIPVFANRNNNSTTLSNLIEGTYKIRWTVSGPCANGSADVIVNVGAATQDVTSVGSGTTTYCDGRLSTILSGTKPLYSNETVQWTANAGNPTPATIASPNSPTTAITNLAGSGVYNFTYTITNNVTGCSSTGTYTIRYTTPPSFVLGLTSPQFLPCGAAQLSIPYSGGGGNSVQWALVSGPSNSTIAQNNGFNNFTTASSSPQLIIGMNVIGTYVIRFRRGSNNASGGCADTYTDITIVTSRPAYQAIAGTPQLLACGIATATLAGNAPQSGDSGTGQWSQISGPNTATIADKFDNRTPISNLVSGVYTFRWIVSGGDGVCTNTQDETRVVVASTPVSVNAGPDITSCYGTPVRLNATAAAANETGTWTVLSENPALPASTIAFSDIHDPKALVNGLIANKTYIFKWTVSNNCGSLNDNVSLSTTGIAGPKQALAGPDQCWPTDSVRFTMAANAPSNGETGTWTLLPGAPNTPVFSNDSNTVVTNVIPGTYRFEWRLDNNSCVPTRDTVVITISNPTTVAVINGGSTINLCGLQTLFLSANQPAASESGFWTQVAGPGGITINNPTSYNNATVTGVIGTRYKFRWTISNNACASSFAEVTYNIGEPPTAAIAGPDQVLCDVTSTTMAANTITAGSGLWSIVSGPGTPVFSNVSSPTSTVSNLKLGTYILKWVSSNSPFCPSTSSNVTIKVTQSANAGPDQQLCNTNATVLAGNEGSTGTWTQTAGAATTIVTNSANTAIVNGMAPGSYTFKYTITSGGCGTTTDFVDVVISPPPSVADAGSDQIICLSSGTSVNISAVAPVAGTGAWSFLFKPSGSTATIANPASPSTTVNNLTGGVYLLEWTVSLGNCSGIQANRDIMRITAYAPPTIAGAMANQAAACQTGVVLTGTTPVVGTGTWTYVSGGTSIPVITAPNSPSTTVSNLDVAPANPYIFRWTITNGTCTPSSNTVSVTVTDVAAGTADAGSDIQVCSIAGTGSATLGAAAAINGTGTWTITGKPALSNPIIADIHSPTTVISNLAPGGYGLRWTVANNSSCSSFDDVSITALPPPTVADAGPASISYCLYAPVRMAAVQPTVGVGAWTVISQPVGSDAPIFSPANAYNAVVNGLVKGTYVFRWTTSNGACATTQDDITVNIEDCQIAIAKSAGNPVPKPDGSYDITFTFKVKNIGSTLLSNVQVQDNLALTFPSPKTFTKVSLNSTGTLSANVSFDGSSDQNMLNPASSSLAANAEETISLVVNVKLN